ncbi:unnamed protein product, partial [Didymodactylos carnosus]
MLQEALFLSINVTVPYQHTMLCYAKIKAVHQGRKRAGPEFCWRAAAVQAILGLGRAWLRRLTGRISSILCLNQNSLEVDFRDPDHDPRSVPGNTPTYLRTVQGFYKEILDYPHKYNHSSPQQSIRQILVRFGGTSTLAELYDNEHHLNTNEVSIKVYTFHSCVYRELNNVLRSGNEEVLLLFAPYIYNLLGGLQEHKRHYHGIVYRGMELESTCILSYKKGLLFYWPGFTYCIKDFQIATKWCGCTAVFIINVPQKFSHACSNIEDISRYRLEKEVLLQPYTCFRVINDPIQHTYNGKNITKIEIVI